MEEGKQQPAEPAAAPKNPPANIITTSEGSGRAPPTPTPAFPTPAAAAPPVKLPGMQQQQSPEEAEAVREMLPDSSAMQLNEFSPIQGGRSILSLTSMSSPEGKVGRSPLRRRAFDKPRYARESY